MADDLDRIKNPRNTAIEVYRSNDAAPESLEQLRFWVTNELRRIQDGFVSTDEAIKVVANAIPEPTEPTVTDCECEDGAPGPPGPQGEQGPQGLPGEDGEVGDLINDSTIQYDKTWSSNKIDTRLEDKPNRSEYNPYKNMKWTGPYASGQLYTRNDVTRDGDWTAVCIAPETVTRPAPQPIGAEDDSLDSVPVFSTQNFTGVVRSGIDYTFLKSGWISKIDIWVAATGIQYDYALYLIDLANPDNPAINKIVLPQLTAGEWNTVAVGSVLVVEGANILMVLEALNFLGTSPVTGQWTRDSNTQSGAPSDQGWVIDNQHKILRIDYNDATAADRSADLLSMISGTEVTFTDAVDTNRFVTYNIIGVFDQGTYVQYDVLLENTGPAGEPLTGNLCDMQALVPVPQPAEYVTEVDYWNTNTVEWATVKGALELNGITQPGSETDLFGINMFFQEASVSGDWNAVAYSSFGSTGTIGSGGFTPTIFGGAGTSGYVPDPGTENGFVLSDNGNWVAQGAGGGEANTSSNLGAGEGLATTKVGVDLPFKSLLAGDGIILQSAANEVEISTVITDADASDVISLLNFASMPDGTLITDTISGNTWTSVNGAQVISGELVLNGTNQYVQHTDYEGFRYEFNGTFSGYWTIEMKIVTGGISPAGNLMILDWRDSLDAVGLSLVLSTSNQFVLRAGDSTVGFDINISSTTIAAASTEYEITVGRGRSGYSLWINGKWEGTGQFGSILNTGPNGLRLGATAADTGHFDGKYRRIRFTKKRTRYIMADFTPESGDSYQYP